MPADPHNDLAAGLGPAQLQLDLQKQRFLRRLAWARSIALVPRLAILLVAVYWLVCAFDRPPFYPWVLPLLLLLAPLLPMLVMPRRSLRTDPAEAAWYCDRDLANHDRFSAAWQFTRPEHQPSRFEAAAIEDGLARLARLQEASPQIPHQPPSAPRWAPLLGLCIACLPALLPLPGRSGPGDEPGLGPGNKAANQTAQGENLTLPPRPRQTPPELGTPEPETLSPDLSGAQPGSEGESQADGQLLQGSPRRSPGEAQKARSGQPNPSSSSGGGQGQPSQSGQEEETPSQQRRPRQPRKASPQAQRRPKPRSREPDPSASSATPGGPSRSGGQMAAVGNQRQGLARPAPNESDSDEEEEELEDEKEENDSRGGVMPLGRDRQQSAARELTISGDGPPSDGRGGPTPPKKSRGTASLVLGIRLPDRIRGQPNPGTAKTSIEQVPPGPNPARPGAAVRAVPAGPTHPQAAALPRSGLAPLIQRYHALLRQAKTLQGPVQSR